MPDPDLALEAHAREELGIDPGALGSPLGAAASSFVSFAVGAVIPLLPWFFTSGTRRSWPRSSWRVAAAVVRRRRRRPLHRTAGVVRHRCARCCSPWSPALITYAHRLGRRRHRLSDGRRVDVADVGPVDVVDGEAEVARRARPPARWRRRRRASRRPCPGPVEAVEPGQHQRPAQALALEVGVDARSRRSRRAAGRGRRGPWSSRSRRAGRRARGAGTRRGRTRLRLALAAASSQRPAALLRVPGEGPVVDLEPGLLVARRARTAGSPARTARRRAAAGASATGRGRGADRRRRRSRRGRRSACTPTSARGRRPRRARRRGRRRAASGRSAAPRTGGGDRRPARAPSSRPCGRPGRSRPGGRGPSSRPTSRAKPRRPPSARSTQSWSPSGWWPSASSATSSSSPTAATSPGPSAA